jgi:Fe-S cluster assembly ATP-binding protein
MLEIQNLKVQADDGTQILRGIDLDVDDGEIHAVMGPNGSGKSTLTKAIAGHPTFEVTGGDIVFEGESILDDEPDERAQDGIFLAFQYPVEVPGVTTSSLLREAYNSIQEARGGDRMDPLEFDEYVRERIDLVGLDQDLMNRGLNVDFSGGEKKRNEILQMAVLQPKLALLDETDSGLDIDALRTVANGINELAQDDNAVLLVTHYQRVLEYVNPDYVHVMIDGRVVKSGDKQLAEDLEEHGYDWLTDEAA